MHSNILITNDDGIHGPGLIPLINEFKNLYNIIVAVPDRERSSISHAITVNRFIRVEEIFLSEIKHNAYIIDGTPADCVRFAFIVLNKKIKFVISGINRGPNLGYDTIYSGTVAAAREGAIYNTPSLAVSLNYSGFDNYESAAKITKIIIEKIKFSKFPKSTFLNINIPDLLYKDIKGFEITNLGNRVYKDYFKYFKDRKGIKFYWLNGEPIDTKQPLNSDIATLQRNKVSITPLQINFHSVNSKFKSWKYFQKQI